MLPKNRRNGTHVFWSFPAALVGFQHFSTPGGTLRCVGTSTMACSQSRCQFSSAGWVGDHRWAAGISDGKCVGNQKKWEIFSEFLTLRPDQWILKSSARCAVVTPLVDAKSDGGNPNFMAQTAGHTYTTSAKMSNPQDNKSYSYYIILLCLWRYMYITHMNLCIYIYMNMIEYV